MSYVDVLSGRCKPGPDVAIIGMGGIGFDVALYLLEHGRAAPLDAKRSPRTGASQPDGCVAPAAAKGAAPPHHHDEALAPALRPHARPHDRLGAPRRARAQWRAHAEGRRVPPHRRRRAAIGVDGKEIVVEADTVIVCAGQVPRTWRAVEMGSVPISGISAARARRASWMRSARCAKARS